MTASIILVRHAQSLWNQERLFTGWADIDLSEEGKRQANRASQYLIEQNLIDIDIVFTSVLKRAIRTAWIILDSINRMCVPIMPDWRLNERHYGILQGQNKEKAAEEYGRSSIAEWRRGYHNKPPAILNPTQPIQTWRSPVPPSTESLADTYLRTTAFIQEELIPACRKYHRIMLVAHGNSLRALIKYFDQISDADIEQVEVEHANPRIYSFNGDQFYQ